MLYVKIMSGEDLPDSSPYKNYKIIQVGDRDVIHFGYPDTDEARKDLSIEDMNSLFVVRYGEPSFETYPLSGTAYVMNQSGKTIDTIAPRKALTVEQ